MIDIMIDTREYFVNKIVAVLRLYKKTHIVQTVNNKVYIIVADTLCRKFFKELNLNTAGYSFWYNLKPHHEKSIIIEIIEGEQL